jgi:mannosyltransferase OCH1-like enzyme
VTPAIQRQTQQVSKYKAGTMVDQKIPRVIIQTNERNLVPKGMYDATQSFITDNPTYAYRYFTDEDALEYLKENFPPKVVNAYNKLIPGAFKADLFRYCVLYKDGGVYIDTGMVSSGPLKRIIKDTDTFIAPDDAGNGGLYNAFICSVPSHPILKEAIDMCVTNIENNNYTSSSLGITGPLVLGKAFEKIVGKDVEPDKDYGNGIRTIAHHHIMDCRSGVLFDSDLKIALTRYPTYYNDMKWYNSKPHYSQLWRKRKVFKN